MHYHRTALNVMALGEKRWKVYPPEQAYYATEHLSTWYQSNFSQTQPKANGEEEDAITCTQFSGDIVLMPSQFAHATLNTKPTMGMAFEFNYDGTPEPLQVTVTK